MDAMDTDMASTSREMAESAADGPAPSRNQLQGQAHQNLWSLLGLARQLINQGKPSLALQAVVMAMRTEGGEHAVLQTLNRARELYRSKMQGNAAADELASLFAECAIAEAQPLNGEPPPNYAGSGPPSIPLDVNSETSILAMSGRKQIMLDAFSDGSSFICLQCGGLVSSLRKDQHLAYWCGRI